MIFSRFVTVCNIIKRAHEVVKYGKLVSSKILNLIHLIAYQ